MQHRSEWIFLNSNRKSNRQSLCGWCATNKIPVLCPFILKNIVQNYISTASNQHAQGSSIQSSTIKILSLIHCNSIVHIPLTSQYPFGHQQVFVALHSSKKKEKEKEKYSNFCIRNSFLFSSSKFDVWMCNHKAIKEKMMDTAFEWPKKSNCKIYIENRR